jgi:predicted transcriptional regulator
MVEVHDVERELKRARPAVATAPQIADSLGCSSEHVRQHLHALEAVEKIESLQAGARAKVYWHESRTTPPEQPPEDNPDQSRLDHDPIEDHNEQDDDRGEPVEQRDDQEPTAREIVTEIAEGWTDDDERLQTRRQAAIEVLEYAIETGEPIGKSSSIVEKTREKYPVEGQNDETYWRKNLRPVLSDVGTYSRGNHAYTVDLGGET